MSQMKDKICIVTGSNSEIRKETATAQTSYDQQMQKLLSSKTAEMLGLTTA